ncbi:TauD/TfdA family dioxygenase [Oceanicoccus sagamiensis]|uniref:TauD/TfdA-like domain-containing protein n=1 Tax=Oceanicoccus sagamiensis TaxID=716816 RepID=A0A1X9N7S7_9GAMM|nr:TauD/TfdA family dioxygenase [Oceanicoccus sagamiensis]ARN73231.1 hypothetical protein BST96_03380 [Oceanicoccus sagamiensis]
MKTNNNDSTSTLGKSELVQASKRFQLPVIRKPSDADIQSADFIHYLKAQLSTHGALLIRGRSDFQQCHFERLLDALHFTPMNYRFGVSPRTTINRTTSTSTEAPAFLPIGVHSEMAYTNERPRKIAFFCAREPKIHGETPIVNNFDMLSDIKPSLLEKLATQQLAYRRYFLKRKARFSFEQQLAAVFGTENTQAIEKLLHDNDMDFEWESNGDLITYKKVNPIVRHPELNRQALNINLFHCDALTVDYEHLRERFSPLKWHAVNQLQRFVRNSHKSTIRTHWGDKELISSQEARYLQTLFWQHSTIFTWRRGDILLLDNIAFSHGRLNVSGPRLILASLADTYNANDPDYQAGLE